MTIVTKALIVQYRCHIIFMRFWYGNKILIGQHAFVSLSQDTISGVGLIKMLPTTLDTLLNAIVVNFIENIMCIKRMLKWHERNHIFQNVQLDNLVHFDQKKVWLDILKGNVTFHFCFMKMKIMIF